MIQGKLFAERVEKMEQRGNGNAGVEEEIESKGSTRELGSEQEKKAVNNKYHQSNNKNGIK